MCQLSECRERENHIYLSIDWCAVHSDNSNYIIYLKGKSTEERIQQQQQKRRKIREMKTESK